MTERDSKVAVVVPTGMIGVVMAAGAATRAVMVVGTVTWIETMVERRTETVIMIATATAGGIAGGTTGEMMTVIDAAMTGVTTDETVTVTTTATEGGNFGIDHTPLAA